MKLLPSRSARAPRVPFAPFAPFAPTVLPSAAVEPRRTRSLARTLAAAWERRAWTATALLATLLLSGCAGHSTPAREGVLQWSAATWPQALQAVLPTDVLLLGEQHDATEHQRLQREAVQWLAQRQQLAALVLEMAERGHSTRGLPPDATEAQVQTALHWNDSAWPWQAYGPVVMAAVRASVPVLGGNLPRDQMRAAMADNAWDRHLPAPALAQQYAALREGHCGLLPDAQIAPMARIQIARDASLARTGRDALKPGQTVVLVAGGGHVLRSVGVPTHWPQSFASKVVLAQVLHAPTAMNSEANVTWANSLKQAATPAHIDRYGDRYGDMDAVIETPALPPRDLCAELRQQWPAATRRP